MSLQAFREKMENLKGEYSFNFSNEDDCAYFLEEFGGEDRLKEKFPEMYESFLYTKENSRKRTDSNLEASSYFGSLGKLNIEMIKDGTYAVLSAPLRFDFIDTTKEVLSDEPASPWQGITIQTNIRAEFSSKAVINTSVAIPQANSYVGNIQSNPVKFDTINNKKYNITMNVYGKDPAGLLHHKKIQKTQNIGNVEYRSISNIIIDDPAPKNDGRYVAQKLSMFYGRTPAQGSKDADYFGGDFYNNVFSGGKVRLLLPIKGEMILNEGVEPLRLQEPGDEVLTRPTATYDYKEQEFVFRNDIIDDKILYNKLKDNFIKGPCLPYAKTNVSFDFSIAEASRSKYDWHVDVRGVQNGSPKTIMLIGAFTYRVKNQLGVEVEEQVSIESVMPEDLKILGREYYKYKVGSNVVYIPPITIYWGCFGKDVKITLADGTEKNACCIKEGDKLKGYDNQILTVREVFLGTDQSIYSIKTKGGREIKVSGGHPMMCEGKDVKALKLKAGDKLNLADGSLEEIECVEVVPYDAEVYNYTFEGVDDGKYIIANGFYAGDLNMQNKAVEKVEKVLSKKEQAFIDEMKRLSEELSAE